MASLRGVNGDVVSFIESNKFVLIQAYGATTEPSTGSACTRLQALPPSWLEDPKNANDARIVRLFTAQVDGTVEDDTLNAKAHVPFRST